MFTKKGSELTISYLDHIMILINDFYKIYHNLPIYLNNLNRGDKYA